MTFSELVHPLIERKDLTTEQAERLMEYMMSGSATEAQIGGVLLGLRIKGINTHELAAFARILRQKATVLEHAFDDLVDTCGTGGGTASFNISTSAAIIACSAGARIAKHGNRAVTSTCGSADVLEALGIPVTMDGARLSHSLESLGIVFLFAQAHHPAMKHVGKARKELGVRTVFNQLGPLLNPAGASRQLIGVYDPSIIHNMGHALFELGCERALIVHGMDGLDEISPVTPTSYVKVWDRHVSSGTLHLSDFGLEPVDRSALAPGKNLEDSAAILREAISDVDSPRSKAVLPSAAAAIWIAGLEDTLPAAVDRARSAIQSGLAEQKLGQLILNGGAA
ncbi:MAG: anthranilate phosphoribosyltransferase [Fimbriimonas sp.]|nr:anthranilate phosphoribosyltransferase [Fimbriimonas sp.]